MLFEPEELALSFRLSFFLSCFLLPSLFLHFKLEETVTSILLDHLLSVVAISISLSVQFWPFQIRQWDMNHRWEEMAAEVAVEVEAADHPLQVTEARMIFNDVMS